MTSKASAFFPSLKSLYDVKKKNLFSHTDEGILQYTELFLFLGKRAEGG